MENSKMEGKTEEKMAPPLAPNENNKVENPPTRNAVSGADFDDKKQRRIMSNRLSARRSKLKRLSFLANLETQAKTLEDQIAELQPQQASYENQKQLLMVEQQTLEQEMEVLQKEDLLRDAEIEKHRAEAKRLRELRVMLQDQLQARLLNIGLLEKASNDQGNMHETT